MTGLLYYSYSRGLSENELVEIDIRVSRNRESVYLFLTELLSNSKRRAKRLSLYTTFVFTISQPLAPWLALAIPAAPASHRFSPMEEIRIRTNKNYPKIAQIIQSKIDNQKDSITIDELRDLMIW